MNRTISLRNADEESIDDFFDDADECLGVDTEALLTDIRLGRGLKSLDLNGKYQKSVVDFATLSMKADNNKKLSHVLTVPRTEIAMPAVVSSTDLKSIRNQVHELCDNFGRSPLCVASALGHEDLVKVLLDHGANVSVLISDGMNAFNLATKLSIHNLLEKELLHWLNDHSTIASKPAMTTSSTEMFDSLYPQINALQKKHWAYSRSPLGWAVSNGLVNSVREIILKGVDTNACDATGRTPIHECASICRLSTDETVIQAVILISEQLLEAGANPNALSISGRNALHELFCMNQDESVKYAFLAEFQASYRAPTVIPIANDDGKKQHLNQWRSIFVRNLLQWGTDALARDRHGLAPIHYCAREDAAECMVEMLTASADATWPTSLGHTALHVACIAGSIKTIRILVKWDGDSPSSSSLLNIKNSQGKVAKNLLHFQKVFCRLDSLWHSARAGSLERFVVYMT